MKSKKSFNELKEGSGILFLSHDPHFVHLAFAKSIKARIRIIPFKKYILLSKKFKILFFFYPLLSFFYALFLKTKEKILFVDGGSSFYVAVFLKILRKVQKIIYLDGDTFFYYLQKKGKPTNRFIKFLTKFIDGAISVSSQSKDYASKFLKVPIKMVCPFCKKIEKMKIERKNYGLFVGRLDPEKNIKKIINFAINCPYFEEFWLVGDGVFKDYVKKISKKFPKIKYFGKQKNVDFFYNKCKFLIHISEFDSFSCVPLEAAQVFCFPFISENCGNKNLFDEFFIVKNLNDFREIENKIKLILEDEEKYKKILKKTIEKIPKKEKQIKKFVLTFKEFLKK